MTMTRHDLTEFLLQRREQSLDTENMDERLFYLLDTLSLGLGTINETRLRNYLESAGIEFTFDVCQIISLYAAITLNITERWKHSIVGENVYDPSDHQELYERMDKLKFDGVFMRDFL